MFTSSALSTPRLTRDRNGCGSPNSTSDTSVAIIEPPQPSAKAARTADMRMCSASLSAAHVRSVQAGDHLAVDPARDGVFRGPIPLLLLGRSTGIGQDPVLPAELG